ncbi:MAG: hypothetical protein C7B46_06295 [Sulfobacillus benefaciens]|uniref:Uncharacterized protein n=1 Tax=Sulfobacillus benefaciens TaxID=453960 RepID=A0A2T2XI62_9FIRM|nr:MAG: hypothetical protein C7B46_06295 [Sulfobacillus benefaciens]
MNLPRARLLSPLLLSLAVAGCGVAGAPPSSPPTPNPHGTVPTSVVIGATPPRAIALKPSRVISPPYSAGPETIQAPVVPGTGMDTLSVSDITPGTSTLTVTSSSHALLWTLPNTGWVGVAEFGNQHGPILLTEGDQSFCGSGGCMYTGYTYSNATHHFLPIPFDPFANLAYRLKPSHRHWQAIVQTGLTASTLLGSASLTQSGLNTSFRTYGPLNGAAGQRDLYALDGLPSGEWVPVGPVNFGPDELNGFVVYPATSLQNAASTYLSEAMQNHPRAAAKMVAAGINPNTLWKDVQPLTAFGLSGSINMAQSHRIDPTEEVFPVSTTKAAGPQETLITYDATVFGAHVHGGWYVTRVDLRKIAMKYNTVADVLKLLMQDRIVTTWYHDHPDGVTTINSNTIGSTDWQANLSAGNTNLFVNIDAVSGKITLAPNN